MDGIRKADDFRYPEAGAGNDAGKQCDIRRKGEAPQPAIKSDSEYANAHDCEQGVVPDRKSSDRGIESEIEKIKRIERLGERIGKEWISSKLGWRP